MHLKSGTFFVINIVGNFGTVFLDNGYFNKAFVTDSAFSLPSCASLVLPYAAVALLGKGSVIRSLLLIFMAVASAMSAELIAVSTIFTHDIYRTCVYPKDSGKKLIFMSHLSVITFEDDSVQTGNVVALLSPLIFISVLTYAVMPQNFDWKILKGIKRVDKEEEIAQAANDKQRNVSGDF